MIVMMFKLKQTNLHKISHSPALRATTASNSAPLRGEGVDSIRTKTGITPSISGTVTCDI